MLKLDDRKWSEFKLSNDDDPNTQLFNIVSTKSSIDKIKLNRKKGSIPYITRSDLNNGINNFIGEQDGYSLDEGNCITIGLDTQTAFYQKKPFYTGQNIQVLRNKFLNEYNAKFIIPMIKNLMKIFSWGSNGATLTRLRRSVILLPIDQKGNPDWEYMEQYIKERCTLLKDEYMDKQQKSLPQYKEVPSLEEKEWNEFKFSTIFPTMQRGKRLKTADHIVGKHPYISSSALQNGVDNFISNSKKVRIFKNCLTIANSGSVGKAFYHKYSFVASDHVTHLSNKNFTPYIYLFFVPIVSRLEEKYSFNREINDVRLKKETLVLPINKKKEPDWEYMEQYTKNLIYKQMSEYIKRFAKAYSNS